MARIRRLTVIAGVAALAASLVMTGPAQAGTPEVFQGSASGTALDLAVLGQQLTLGSSEAEADSAGNAEATGTGVLTSLFSKEQKATAANGAADVKAKECDSVVTLPDLEDVLSLGLACSAAKADSKARSASAEGSVAEAAVDAASLIQKVEETTGTEISNEVKALGTTLAGLLDPVCDATQDTHTVVCDAQTTITDVIESVLHTKTLDVAIGKATSSVTTTDSSVTSKASASGAVVKILPLPQVNGLASSEPVVTIRVGASEAEATYDRAKGSAGGSADPAIVRITFNTVLTKSLADTVGDLDILGRLDNIVIDPNDLLDAQALLGRNSVAGVIESCEDGRAICILKGSPLESKIYLATSKVTENPDGSVVAVADAVRMDLVTGVDLTAVNGLSPQNLETPGVRLSLASVQAGVGGRPAVDDDDDDPGKGIPPVTELDRNGGPLPPAELPRTGGLPVLPVLGAGALSLAGVLRRAVRKAR